MRFINAQALITIEELQKVELFVFMKRKPLRIDVIRSFKKTTWFGNLEYLNYLEVLRDKNLKVIFGV